MPDSLMHRGAFLQNKASLTAGEMAYCECVLGLAVLIVSVLLTLTQSVGPFVATLLVLMPFRQRFAAGPAIPVAHRSGAFQLTLVCASLSLPVAFWWLSDSRETMGQVVRLLPAFVCFFAAASALLYAGKYQIKRWRILGVVLSVVGFAALARVTDLERTFVLVGLSWLASGAAGLWTVRREKAPDAV